MPILECICRLKHRAKKPVLIAGQNLFWILPKVMKICLVRLSALGDVVLMVPLVRTLQAQIPDLDLTWITSSSAYSILQGLTGVKFDVIEKPRSLGDYWAFYQRYRHQRFDVLLAAQASFRSNLLYPGIRASRKIGFDPSRSKDGHRFFIHECIETRQEHLLDSFLGFARALGITQPELSWHLDLSTDDLAYANTQIPSGSWLAVNPSASKPERNWLPQRYAEVINYAQEKRGMSIVLTGGPSSAEREFALETLRGCHQPESILNLVGATTPKQLAAVLARVQVLLSPDTGPAHIATAVGTRVVGLYAVAPSTLSGPYLSKLWTVDCYPQAVEQILHLDPKTVPWGTRVHDPKAMELISVDEVIKQLEAALA